MLKKRIPYRKRVGCLAEQGFGHSPKRAPCHILLCRSRGHSQAALQKNPENGRKIPGHFSSGRKKSVQPVRKLPAPLAPLPKPNSKKSAKITVITGRNQAQNSPLRTRISAPFDIAQTRAKFVCSASFSACPKTSLFSGPKTASAPRFWRAGSELQGFFSLAERKFLKKFWRAASDK